VRKDLEDWLRGEAQQEPLFVAGNVAVSDVAREVEYPVIPLSLPLFGEEFLPAEERANEDNPLGEGAIVEAVAKKDETEGRAEESIEESIIEGSLIERNLIAGSSIEEDAPEEPIPLNVEAESTEGGRLGSSTEENISGKVASEASIFEDPFANFLTESNTERLFEKNEQNDDGRIGNAKENDDNKVRQEIDDGEKGRLPRRELEWEATRFAERLRRLAQMRRSSSLYKRSGFRGNRGCFFASCILALFLIGTVVAAYRHLQRNSYASLMGGAEALYGQEQYNPAFDAYKQASDRYPGRVEPLLGMAHAAERVGRVEEAIMAYRASLELFPANAAPSRSGIFYEIGRLYSTLKAWNRAQENFQEAATADSTNYNAHFALGGALEEQGRPEEAIKAYKQALDLSPSSDAAQEAIRRMSLLLPPAEPEQDRDTLAEQKYEHAIQVGNVALELKHYEEASRYFSEALAIRSDDADLWVGFADARGSLGDAAGAVKSLERALERDPGHDDAKSKLAKLKEEQSKKKSPSRSRPRKTPRSAPRSSKKNTSVNLAGKSASSSNFTSNSMPNSAGVANKTPSRREFFVKGVDHYRKEEYAQAFEAFLACLRAGEREPLPSFPLAGETGPLWKGFRRALNIPSDVKLLAEAVHLNPADRDLYLNLSMTGTKMGVDKKTWRTALNDIYAHALARQ
jgi:tetratricopeptide (TPR) repeat protein